MKNKENLKTIWKTEETLKSLKTLQEEIQKLIHDYKYVWNIELINRVDGLGVFSHSFSNFILVSNTIDKINKIKELLKFKKEKKKIQFNSVNTEVKFKKIIEGYPVFELREIH